MRKLILLAPAQWKTRTITVPISPKVYKDLGITDTAITNKGVISWNMEPSVNFGSVQAVRAQDIVAMDIVRANINDRPIYFLRSLLRITVNRIEQLS